MKHSFILKTLKGNGTFEKEDALLEYCRQNHITYITLFDVRKIFITESQST